MHSGTKKAKWLPLSIQVKGSELILIQIVSTRESDNILIESRLLLLAVKPTVTFPDTEHCRTTAIWHWHHFIAW